MEVGAREGFHTHGSDTHRRPPVRRRDRGHRGRQDDGESLEARRRRVRSARLEPLGAQRRAGGRRRARRPQAVADQTHMCGHGRVTTASRPACGAFSASASAWRSSSAARSGSASSGRRASSPASSPSPPTILAVWIVGGLYTLLGAVCLAELGTMLPQAGGYYVYARRAFGDTVGFAVGWTDWLTYCAVLGYVSIGMGEFVGAARAVARRRRHARRGRRCSSASSRCSGRACASAAAFRKSRPRSSSSRSWRSSLACFAASPAHAPRDAAPRRSAAPSLVGVDRGAAVGRHHLRRLAERAVLHRRRPRSGAATCRAR